jgi:hypothetical protein
VTIERAFGSLKRRFKVLDDAKPFFPFETQVDIVIACCIIHNWVIEDEFDELIITMLHRQVVKQLNISSWLTSSKILQIKCE